MIKIISLLIIPLILSLAIQAHASLLSIHTPAKGATVPIGPLTVTGGAISSNSTLKDCNVQLRTNADAFVNVTGTGPKNFSTWSVISNETTPGPNQVEAELKCIKPDGSYLIKHNVHNFTVSASDAPIHANLTNQLVPNNFTIPSANFSRPIQDNLTNITGVLPHPSHTQPLNVNTSSSSVPISSNPPSNATTHHKTLSIISTPHVSGHHKTIHIHFSH